MSASILNILKKVPIPLFGNALTATVFGSRKASTLARLAPWGIPVGGGALWFVWPAVDQTWKDENGLGSSIATAQKEEKIELSEEALTKIETAYVIASPPLSEAEQSVVSAMAEGDFSALEKEWDEFQLKASNPSDDDDDDDDDDEDDEDEDDEDEDDAGANDDDEDAEDDDDDDEDE